MNRLDRYAVYRLLNVIMSQCDNVTMNVTQLSTQV